MENSTCLRPVAAREMDRDGYRLPRNFAHYSLHLEDNEVEIIMLARRRRHGPIYESRLPVSKTRSAPPNVKHSSAHVTRAGVT
jgi:hypothetical protein